MACKVAIHPGKLGIGIIKGTKKTPQEIKICNGISNK